MIRQKHIYERRPQSNYCNGRRAMDYQYRRQHPGQENLFSSPPTNNKSLLDQKRTLYGDEDTTNSSEAQRGKTYFRMVLRWQDGETLAPATYGPLSTMWTTRDSQTCMAMPPTRGNTTMASVNVRSPLRSPQNSNVASDH
jgi:hypothetical protein